MNIWIGDIIVLINFIIPRFQFWSGKVAILYDKMGTRSIGILQIYVLEGSILVSRASEQKNLVSYQNLPNKHKHTIVHGFHN